MAAAARTYLEWADVPRPYGIEVVDLTAYEISRAECTRRYAQRHEENVTESRPANDMPLRCGLPS